MLPNHHPHDTQLPICTIVETLNSFPSVKPQSFGFRMSPYIGREVWVLPVLSWAKYLHRVRQRQRRGAQLQGQLVGVLAGHQIAGVRVLRICGRAVRVAPNSPPQPIGVARCHEGLLDDIVLLHLLDVLLTTARCVAGGVCSTAAGVHGRRGAQQAGQPNRPHVSASTSHSRQQSVSQSVRVLFVK